MNKIAIDGVYKEHIYKYLQENIKGYRGHEEEIKEFEQNGVLEKNIATTILGDLICSSKVTRIYLSYYEPREEFKGQMLKANKIFDNIPKGKDYEEDSYSRSMDTDIYNNMDADTIKSYLQTGIRLDEFYKKVYLAQQLRESATSTIQSIRSIDDNEIQISDENKTNINNISEELSELLDQSNTDVKKIQMYIEAYNKEAVEIWKTYLDNGKGSLVHNITKGAFEGDFNTKYMSTSLITNKTMALFDEGRGNNYGLIIRPNNIINASDIDTWTNNGPVNSYEKIFGRMPSLKLPWEIEKSCVDRTIEQNGEMLNYDNGPCFSEIVVDGYEIEAMYYRSNGEGELAPNYETAKKMAEERGVELIELDISKEREQQGLEPMTEGMQKKFFNNILRKQFLSEEQIREITLSGGNLGNGSKEEIITDKLYKHFYNRYLELRSNRNYEKEDILEVFHSIISEKEMTEMKDYYGGEITNNKTYSTNELTEWNEEQLENGSLSIDRLELGHEEADNAPKGMKSFIKGIKNSLQPRSFFEKIKDIFSIKTKMLPEAKIDEQGEEQLEVNSWELSNWGIDKEQFMVEHAQYMEEYSNRPQVEQTIEQPVQDQGLTIHSGHEEGFVR